MEDRELLRDYIEHRSEAAFNELVARHINLVYSTALRLVCDAQLARDVAQEVFIVLARNPRGIKNPRALAGWLYRTARFTAGTMIRSERRRRERERAAVELMTMSEDADALWRNVAPHLDDALAALEQGDQDALALRFFESKSFREVGDSLGISDDTAQKRVSRALERIRSHLAGVGITASVPLLGSVISSHGIQPAPAGIAAGIAGRALATVSSNATALKLIEFMTATKMKTAGIALVLAIVAATPIVLQRTAGPAKAGIPSTPPRPPEFAVNSATQQVGTVARSVTDVLAALGKLSGEPDYERRYARSRELANSVSLSDIPNAIGRADIWHMQNRADKLFERQLRGEFMNLLIARLARSDPKLALETALHVAPSPKAQGQDFTVGDAAIEVALTAWVHQNAGAASEWVQNHPAEWGAHRLKALLIQSLASENPELALAEADKQSERQQYYSAIFAKWASAEPATAAARAQNLPAGALKREALTGLLQTWALTDAAGAAGFVQSLPPDPYKMGLLGEVAKRYAEADGSAAIQWCRSLPSKKEQSLAATYVVDGLAAADPRAAARFLESDGLSAYYQYLIADQWARTDVLAAAAWVKQLREGPEKQRAFDVIAGRWTHADPQAAAEFAFNLPAEQSPHDGPAVTGRNNLLLGVVQQWARDAAPAALDWVRALPESDFKNGLIETAGETWAKTAPAAAASFVASLPSGDLQNNLALKVAAAWGVVAPETAAEWVSQFPEGPMRDKTVCELVRSWTSTDVAGAEAWLKGLPPEKVPEQAIPDFVYGASFLAPDSAARWVGRLPEGEQRDRLINCLASQWIQGDEGAAKKWIEQTPMAPEIKERWLAWKPQ